MTSTIRSVEGTQADVAATSLDRRVRMLRSAMGPAIAAALEDRDVIEILVNPDGSLWLDP